MKSDWRRRSAEVIAEALAGLSSDANERECRLALRAAYPFGSPSQASHPYKMWLKEVRSALDERFGVKKQKAIAPPRLEFRAYANYGWTLTVQCDWHNRVGACLACGPLHEAYKAALAHPDLARVLAEAVDDEAALLIAQDIVEEVTGHRPVVMGE